MKKVTVSGSFRTNPGTDKDRYDFTEISGLLPDCDDEFLIPYAIRMFPIWKSQSKKHEKVSFNGLIKIYVDSVEDVEGIPECVGKNIKEMTWEELQSLACYLNLREIPMYRQGALRAAQEKAYECYVSKVQKRRVFKTAKDVSQFKEKIRMNLEALMISQSEIEERVSEEVGKAFNMLVDKNNPQNSYSFSKLDNIIIEDYSLVGVKSKKVLK